MPVANRAAARVLSALPLAAVVALASCSGATPSPAPPATTTAQPTTAPPTTAPTSGAPSPAALAPGDWPTYHRDNLRSGSAPTMPPVHEVSTAWHADLDGAVYGQPLVVGDTVYAATENDTVYALAAATGRPRWSRHLGTPVPRTALPCGNIDPLGITSTMVYDPATRQLFALAETTGGAHTLFGLDASTGAVRLTRPAEPPRGDRIAHQQRGALTLYNGWVYVPYGGLAGDCAQYIGSIVGVPTTGTAALRSYAVPTTREAGIWTPGGGIVLGNKLIWAVGNGESHTTYDGSDSVIALDPELRLVDRFWPTTWAPDNIADLDLNSMTPVPLGQYLYANGKSGTGYVLRANHLGGEGGQIAKIDVCRPFGGAAAVTDGTIYLPCSDGPRALTIAPNGTPTVRWHAPISANGSPVVGGGLIWVPDYRHGTLYTLDPATGRVVHQLSTGELPHFASPTLSGTHAYLGTMTGVLALTTR